MISFFRNLYRGLQELTAANRVFAKRHIRKREKATILGNKGEFEVQNKI
jgi:hypothetical protein